MIPPTRAAPKRCERCLEERAATPRKRLRKNDMGEEEGREYVLPSARLGIGPPKANPAFIWAFRFCPEQSLVHLP